MRLQLVRGLQCPLIAPRLRCPQAAPAPRVWAYAAASLRSVLQGAARAADGGRARRPRRHPAAPRRAAAGAERGAGGARARAAGRDAGAACRAA
eukprot:SAG11_NODE_3017_length_2760_cov_2.538519_1_plen_93_part_10